MSPEDALSAVMCTFSQHVSGGEARHIFDALPTPLRPLLERCMVHRDEPAARFGRKELLRRLARHLKVSAADAEEIAEAVLGAVTARLPPKEVADVASQLPAELRALWLAKGREARDEPHPILLEIQQKVALPAKVTPADAFAGVMCVLSSRLTGGEARHLMGELPLRVHPLVEECITARGERPETFGIEGFYNRVAKRLDIDDAKPVAWGVIRVVKRYLLADVIAHVRSQLPPDLQELWDLKS